MAFMAVLESDLRALSAEARRRYPTIKDGAEHAILKLRSLSSPGEIAHNEDILRIFLMACEVRTVKLSIIGLSCLQKLISHVAVSSSVLREILMTLKDHAEMVDEGVQLKTLQTISIIFQSRLHPENEILQRLVSTLDRCASRTCSLPVETVELMPPQCSRFSLTCLQKLFSLSSYSNEVSWNVTRSEVSKISITVLMTRCEYILSRFLINENGLGDYPLPKARLEEIIYVLKELPRLVILHPDAASILPLHPCLRSGVAEKKENHDNRPHLFVLLPSFCELITSRELRIRELVQVLLRLVTRELSLENLSLVGEKNTSR